MNEAGRVINGTYGTIWVDGELWAEVDSFEAKITVEYEDIDFANSRAKYRKPIGWTGEGSLTIKKVYSRMQKKMADYIKEGKYVSSTIVGKVADPDAYGSERVVLNDVTFDSFNLLKFEQKALGSEDVAFKFSDYEMIDSI